MRPTIKKVDVAKFCAVVIACIVCDQVSKTLIYNHFYSSSTTAPVVHILPFMNFLVQWNFGISFGMLNDTGRNQIILSIIAFCIIATLIMWYKQSKDPGLVLPFALIIGGAIGNIIDRMAYGSVLDFIDLHAFGYHFPVFNISDSLIVLGAFIALYSNKL